MLQINTNMIKLESDSSPKGLYEVCAMTDNIRPCARFQFSIYYGTKDPWTQGKKSSTDV